MEFKYIIRELEEIPSVVEDIFLKSKYKIFIFKGDLGAGKTTLIKEIIKYLGSKDKGSSPTFSIVNEYDIEYDIENKENIHKIYHFDLYRINHKEELLEIGFDEYIDSGNYCFIEWGEIIEEELPEHHKISIEVLEGRRIIRMYF